MKSTFSFIILTLLLSDIKAQVIDEGKITSLVKNQNYQGVIEYFEPQINAGVASQEVLGYLGYANFMVGNLRRAEIYYQKIFHDSSNDIAANHFLGLINSALNTNAAEFYLRRSISLEPEKSPAYRELGDLFFKQNEKDSAFVNYQRAYLLDAGNIKSIARYTGMLMSKQQFAKADSILNVVGRSSDSTNQTYLRILLQCKFESKNFSKCISPGEALVNQQENSPAVINQLVEAYYFLKNYDHCIHICEYLRLIKAANEVTLFYEAQAYAAVQLYKTSSDVYRDCLTLAISPTAETYKQRQALQYVRNRFRLRPAAPVTR